MEKSYACNTQGLIYLNLSLYKIGPPVVMTQEKVYKTMSLLQKPSLGEPVNAPNGMGWPCKLISCWTQVSEQYL